MLRLLIALIVALPIGCAHQVRIDSNVKEAEVRVDGERLGAVKDGATFTERGGIGQTYDIELIANGYVTRRQIVKPSEVDPWVGGPAMCLAGGSCCLAGCGAPLFALYAATADRTDTVGQVVGYSVAGGLVGAAIGSIAIAAFGIERLPDVVQLDLTSVDEAEVSSSSAPMVPVQAVATPESSPSHEEVKPDDPAPTPDAPSTLPTAPKPPPDSSPPPIPSTPPSPRTPAGGGVAPPHVDDGMAF